MVVVDGARKGQVKEPRGPVRPMLLNNELYIGKFTLEIIQTHCIYLQKMLSAIQLQLLTSVICVRCK